MLIAKSIKLEINDIAVLKLSSGEELMGKIVAISDSEISITKPVVAQIHMMNAQQAGVGFLPFMATVEEADRFTFALSSLVLKPMKARQDMAANYLRMTTGLTIPTGADQPILR